MGDLVLILVAAMRKHVAQIEAPCLRPPSCGGPAPTAYRSTALGPLDQNI